MATPRNISTPCLLCRHLEETGDNVGSDPRIPVRRWRCTAFPNVDIPAEILRFSHDHRRPWVPIRSDQPQTDNGVLFEDEPDADVTLEQLIPLSELDEELEEIDVDVEDEGV